MGLLAFFVGRAEAQPLVDAARGHFKAGEVYFGRGDFRRALIEFQEAQRDADRPELDYNLGETYDRLGDAASAARCYRRYLDRRPGAADAPEVRARVEAADLRTGRLRIASVVPGALFLIDGQPVTAVEAAAPLALTEGRHSVKATRDGYQATTAEVDVAAGSETRLALDPTRASSRWWIGVLVGAVLVVAGIAAGVAVATGRQSPTLGNFVPMMIATVP